MSPAATARNIMDRCGLCGHKESLHVRTFQFGTAQMGTTQIDDACANGWTLTANNDTWVEGATSCACSGYQRQAEIMAMPPDSDKSDWGICGMKGCDHPGHQDHTYQSLITVKGHQVKIRVYLCPPHGFRCAVALRTYDPVKWRPSFESSRIRAWEVGTGKPVKITDLEADQ